jgi:glycosyltransferase involved in cell wall biosynthesis
MILKNEAHTILATLRTVKDVVDCWYILDTGSEDGTQDIIEEFMAKEPALPGRLFEEPFIDYGATRNRILVLAKEHGNPIFTLMLSADEELMNPQEFRSFLQDMRYARGPMHGAYPVVMNTGIKFDSVRIARVDAGWRYRARVHEYLAPPNGPYIGIFRSKVDINVKFNATDGPRRFKSQWFIKKILEEDLEKDPNDTRSIYYLARTNSGIDNHTAAFYYYDLLAKRSKWEEEVYHGMVMKALESKQIPSISWKERQTMLLDAYLYKPNSMDALHALAQDHFDSGRHLLAYLFALRAVQIPIPPGLNVVENVLLRPQKYLYDYEGHRLLGFAAREIGEWEQCLRSFNHVLNYNPDDNIVRERIQLCEQRFKAAGGRLLPRPPVFEAPPSPKSSTSQQENQDVDAVPLPHTLYGTTAPSTSSSHGFFSFTTIIVCVFLLAILAFAWKKFARLEKLKI